MDPKPETIVYVCGDCGTEAVAKPGDITQCLECGYRIMFKKRTRRGMDESQLRKWLKKKLS